MILLFFLTLCTCLCAHDYDLAFFDYSKEIKQPSAVAIIAYNRPEYFGQLLDSLAKNPESRELPFFFFLDGGDEKAQEENKRLIENAPFAQKFVIAREINYGCPKNHIDSKRFLFDWCHFERIVVLEEDLIVSKNYLKVLLDLHDWANANYSNIGTVQLWFHCLMSREEKLAQRASVRETYPHWSLVTYCMGKNVWDAISPMLYYYEEHFIDPLLSNEKYDRARSKPGYGPTYKPFRKWIHAYLSSHDRTQVLSAFQSPLWDSSHRIENWLEAGRRLCNQDQMHTLALWLNGYTRLQTVVNRAVHIGAAGISGNYDTSGLQLDEFEEDELRIVFKKI